MSKRTTRPPGRPPKRAEAGRGTEQELLKAASSLFMEFGYDRVSLEQIAEACNVTKAAVYYYFGNKARLFTLAMLNSLQHAKTATQSLLEEDKPLKERLIGVTVKHLSAVRADYTARMKEAEKYLSQEQLESIRQAEIELHRVMEDTFRSAIEGGELKARPPLLLAHAFSGLLLLGNRSSVMAHYASREEAARDIVELFLEGTGSPADT
jgi:AcrR family transcriptional regulator